MDTAGAAELKTAEAKVARGRIAEFLQDDSGVTAIEYGLLAALIAVVCIGAFTATGGSLGGIYTAWSAAVLAAL